MNYNPDNETAFEAQCVQLLEHEPDRALRRYVASKLECFWRRARRVLIESAFIEWRRWSETGGDCCHLSERPR